MGAVRLVVLGLLRGVQYSGVSTVNGHYARVNCLREDDRGFSLPSQGASCHRSVPVTTVDLVVRLYVQGRAAFLSKRVGAWLVARTLKGRIVFPSYGYILQ